MRENILKNLNNKALAQVAVGPLPKVKKDPKDKLSKRKHQITHLAGLVIQVSILTGFQSYDTRIDSKIIRQFKNCIYFFDNQIFCLLKVSDVP